MQKLSLRVVKQSDHTGEPSPCGAERESELMASELEEALKPRAWLFKIRASILKGWVAKEVIAPGWPYQL